jgi:hypothetical protein
MSAGLTRMAAANAARLARRGFGSAGSGQRRGKNLSVRRKTYNAGEREKREWRAHNVFSLAERNARFAAINEWSWAQKEPGKPCGALSWSAQRVLDYLMGTRNYRTGQCDPAYSTIARDLRICLDTVSRCIKQLVDAGLLNKLRRSQPVEDPEPDGPQIEQISNAYWFSLPKRIAMRVAQLLGRGHKPADQAQREKDDAEAVQAMLKTLSVEELARFRMGDLTPLSDALASFGRSHDRRSTAIPVTRELPGREG